MARYKIENRNKTRSEIRDRLLNAAASEFAREGFVGANVKKITQIAGVATGTIYNYFPSKKDLMFALLEETGSAHCEFIAEKIYQTDNVTIRVERLFEAGFGFIAINSLRGKVLFSTLQGTNNEFKEYLSQIYQPLSQLIHDDILNPGIEQGVFQALDPGKTTMMIMTFFLGVGSTVNENGDTPIDLQEAAEFVLRALGTDLSNNK